LEVNHQISLLVTLSYMRGSFISLGPGDRFLSIFTVSNGCWVYKAAYLNSSGIYSYLDYYWSAGK